MDISAWLRNLKLDQYNAAVTKNDIDLSVLNDLTIEDCAPLVVVSIGHRRKLLSAITAFTALSKQPSESLAPPNFGPSPPPEVRSRSSEAERRHLTVMLVDLVGSTAMSSRVDPEGSCPVAWCS